MSSIADYIETRDKYISLVKAELLGPGSEISIPDEEHELISASPDRRYSIGVLYTKYNRFRMDNDDPARVESNADTETNNEELVEETTGDHERAESEAEAEAEEENLDEEIGLAAQNMPSSMGLTFLVSTNIEKLSCHVEFATYRRTKAEDCRIPFSPENPKEYEVPSGFENIAYFDKDEGCLKIRKKNLSRKDVFDLKERDILDSDEYGLFPALYKLCDQLRRGHVRIPHSLAVLIDFSGGDYSDSNSELDGTNVKITALKRRISDTLYSITVMMVNDDDRDSNGERCIFQPKITLSTEDNGFAFQEYSRLVDFEYLDDEEKSLELQYRNKKVYGSGLGTSVNWEIDEDGKGIIYNDFFPIAEVPSMDFSFPEDASVNKQSLSMKYLSDLSDVSKEIKITELKSIVKAYQGWIEKLERRIPGLDQKFRDIAAENMQGCRKALDRMRNGITSLSHNDNAWKAFSLANRAMFMQRVHLKLQAQTSAQDRYPGDEELSKLLLSIDYHADDGATSDQYYWRPFQIAFLLMSIDSIINEESSDRNLVDLIWFPTGGGKTEAYLGLTAFSIFYRRLANLNSSDGTTVIMRYTLRLLAAQQFTRASTLICACEYIREDAMSRRPNYKRYNLGTSPISIGLWIGREHIPNTNRDAKKALRELLGATPQELKYKKERYNKFQVLKCPWCGTKLTKERDGSGMKGTFGYRMRNNRHFELFCPQESCYFNQRGTLPVQIIDEELYATPPTLLFGTVDKFAMFPWERRIGNFFAVNNENRPPELIIQDELHLISGPLGTMVGLYESVIDALCKGKGLRPKIVASTATIRRAKEQCAALYNREVMQFPHPGIDAEDSFFAREAIIDHDKGIYGRDYIGLMPSGKSKAMMEIRSIASLAQTIYAMDLPDEIKDKFWTLTVYFNSLKDLGKCTTLVEDDVKEYIHRTAYRLGTGKNARNIGRADELTSRVTTTQLNETLEKLEKLEYSKENEEHKRRASNILLATNMISVGIDVARLNVMLLVGQPKLTSEYIQASSRVGRSYPGVAFAMYDGAKSRDRSHYEQFKQYHESFYKHVEPTGATPFSKPARDRALHAVVIAILRMLEPELIPEQGAALFTREKYAKQISQVKEFIGNRAIEITKRLNENMEDDAADISSEIDYIFEKWEKLAEDKDEDHFYYGESFMFKYPDKSEGRLLKGYNTAQRDPAFDTMTSMRNVDSTVRSNILIWEGK